MALYMFSHSAISILKQNLQQNIEKYHGDVDWIEEFLTENTIGTNDWLISINTDLDLSEFSLYFDKNNKVADEDLKNIKLFYESMKDLPMDIATDERFWAYLTHVTYRDYVKQRWGVGVKDNNILGHYFFKPFKTGGDRHLLRNAISQLWWFGHITYDEGRENPYELTEYLLQVIDFARSFGERSFSRNPDLIKIILSILKDDLQFTPKSNRDTYRKLFKDINQDGGIKVLDFLDYEDIKNIIEKSLGINRVLIC